MEPIEIFGRRLTIVEDNSGSCKRCALYDICPAGPMPCEDADGLPNRIFELVKE